MREGDVFGELNEMVSEGADDHPTQIIGPKAEGEGETEMVK